MFRPFSKEVPGGGDHKYEEDVPEAEEGDEVQPEAEDIGEEPPSNPAMTKVGPLGTSHVVATSAALGPLLHCVIILGQSRPRLLKTKWGFHLPIN